MRNDRKSPTKPGGRGKFGGLTRIGRVIVFFYAADRFGLASFAGFFAAFVVFDVNFRKAFNSFAGPTETAFFVTVRVVNPSDLQSGGEKILVNKCVVIGEKNAEAGMGVIPADDALVRKVFVFDLVDMLPSILGEGDVGSRLRRIQAGNPRGDVHPIAVFFADEHAADFGFAIGTRVLPDLTKHFAFDNYARLALVGFAFSHGGRSVRGRLPELRIGRLQADTRSRFLKCGRLKNQTTAKPSLSKVRLAKFSVPE